MSAETDGLRRRIAELEAALSCATQDVNAGQPAAQRPIESEHRYRTMVEHAPVGITSHDTGGFIIAANPRACEIFGSALPEVLGKNVRDFTHPDDLDLLDERVQSVYRRERQAVTFEHRVRRPDGRPLWVRVTVTLLWSESGVPLQGIGVMQDISELKAADQERQRLQQQMQEAQRLESLGVLAGGIAHDFNNLLCGMLGGADLALVSLEPGHPARPDLELLQETAQRAAELCRQMLAYSGKGRFVVETLDLSKLVERTRHLVEVSVSKKTSLRFDLACDLPGVDADASQLRQILINLVVNASEAFGDRSGTVTVATGAMDCDRAYLESVYPDEHLAEGRYVFLEVADNGCGMDAAVQQRIFDPFFTTKFTGRGLGLAATLGIVRGHHGALKVYSEPNRGTTVKVLLPASPKALSAVPEKATSDTWRGSGVALLADDEPAVRRVGRRMLERLGFEVLLAEDGEQAVRLMREQHDRIVVVILDLTMPGLSGEEAFREMRRIRPDVRVILTSGYNEQDTTARFAGKGLAGFLQKPFQLALLRDRVRAVVDR